MKNSPATESAAASELARGFAWLRFSPPLEAEFRASHLAASLRWTRICLLIAIGTSIGFSLIDHLVIHALSSIPDLVRFGLQFPLLIVVLLATNRRFHQRWYERAMLIGGPLFGIGTVAMASTALPEHVALVGSRLLLVTFFFFFMSGLRMLPALCGNLCILTALIGAGLSGAMPGQVATYLSFALISANVIGAAGAYALEHANRKSFLEHKLLTELAGQDGLTQLMNRQTFDTRVRDAWRQAVQKRCNVSVIMIDVDHFKLYNDHYGHQAGDDCLRCVAATVRNNISLEHGDIVARFGGEEFIAVLIDRSEAEACAVAQRIVADVAALDMPHEASPGEVHVTVSVGLATRVASRVSGYDDLASLADTALYAAKRDGRNRYHVAVGPTVRW